MAAEPPGAHRPRARHRLRQIQEPLRLCGRRGRRRGRPRSGAVRVTTATAAIDAGQVVNPNGLINQTEGGIIQATSWTLKERVGFDRGGIISRDWQGYPILTFPEVPVVSVTVLDRPTEKSLGAGEAAQGPTAAAIANAVAHATGARLRDLPLAPERVKAAAFG